MRMAPSEREGEVAMRELERREPVGRGAVLDLGVRMNWGINIP